MLRTLLVLAAGIAIGAVATALHAPSRQPAAGSASGAQSAAAPRRTALEAANALAGTPEGPATSAPDPVSVGIEEASAWYRLAAGSSAGELRALITETAEGPASEGRRFALHVLYGRLAEIDPDGAIEALALVDGSDLGAAVALDVLRRLGIEAERVERVLRAAPGIEPAAFRAAAAVAAAETSPAGAIAIALEIEERAVQARAIRRVAESWARRDPRAALARGAGLVPGEHAGAFREAVLYTWSREAPESMLGYLGESRLLQGELITHGQYAVGQLAHTEPRRVLELAERLPQPLDNLARQVAMRRWAETSPAEALGYLDTLRPGAARDQILSAYGQGYARADPDGALAWARGLGGRNPEILSSVLAGIARSDPARAFDLALAGVARDDAPGFGPAGFRHVRRLIFGSLSDGSAPDEALTRRVLEIDDEALRGTAVQALASVWSSRDPGAALDWMLVNRERVGASAFAQVAQQLGRQDPQLAASYTQQIPAEARGTWIRSVARAYAQSDPQGALGWIAQYRGDPVYPQAAAAVVTHTARRDPAAAASLLDGIGTADRAQLGAYTRVAQQWANRDPYAARNWTMSHERGEPRDWALTGLIHGEPEGGLPDPALLEAFSNDIARQRALVGAINRVAQTNGVDAARALIDEHISDPDLRRRAEQMLSTRPGAFQSGMIIDAANSGFLVPQR